MKKRLIHSIVLLLSLSLSCSIALAYGSQREHDKDLKRVLFGNADYSLRGEKYDTFRAIADAAALCIDQFSSNKTEQKKKGEFDDLQTKVFLSMTFNDIDLNEDKNHNNITPNTHRLYTHKGWNFSEYPDKEFWKIRKKILIETVQQKVFTNSISWFPWLAEQLDSITGPSEQCDAFCAMIYYVHILGDHLEGDKPDKLIALEPLAQYESLSSPGIIPELKEYLQVLFVDQKNTRTFMALMQELSDLGIEAEKVYYSKGGIDTEEKCKINQDNAEKLLDILEDKVPKLLANEDFYKKAFQ